MSSESPATRFESTESYYAAHQPGYGDAVVRYLVERFALDGERVLDLGCGAGQLGVPLAAHASEVVGVDPNSAMLEHASERASDAGIGNVRWLTGSDADLPGLAADVGTVRLATMGRSFHWMDQDRTLQHLHGLTDDAGGVAIVTDAEWLVRGTESWQDVVYDAVTDYLDDVPERTGPVSHDDDPWDVLVADHGFRDVETRTFEVEREWTVEDAIGYVFSLSYCAPTAFGDDQAAFTDDVRDRLATYDAPLAETAAVDVIAGRK